MGFSRDAVYRLIDTERQRQVAKHGEQDGNTDERWLSILMEEVGEAAKALNEWPYYTNRAEAEIGLLNEIVHCAAVAVAWLEKRGG